MWGTVVTQRDNVGNSSNSERQCWELYVSQNIVNYAVQEAETQKYHSDSSNSERQCGER